MMNDSKQCQMPVTRLDHKRQFRKHASPFPRTGFILLILFGALILLYTSSLSSWKQNTSTAGNKIRSNRLAMGFTKTVIKEGNGQKPKRGQSVTVHCTGYGKNKDL